MALTPADKQARYRDRLKEKAQTNLETVEAALVEEAARCATLSSEDRAALADKLADLAMRYQWRAQKHATRLEPCGLPPVTPPKPLGSPLRRPPTSAVMQRYHVYIACRRDLGAKFGKFSAASGPHRGRGAHRA
jgi:hypothetical protein